MKTQESVRKGVLRFAEIAKDPEAYARRWKETNQGPVIGFFCSYLPEEVIVAAGDLPFRISRAGGQYPLADGHLQAYCCSPVRGALEAALSGQLEFLDGSALIVTLRGTSTVVDYYRLLLKELQQRIDSDVSMVKPERYRLLWDNLPIWHRTRWLSDRFAAHGACLVADTYTSGWCGPLEHLREDDFLGSLAEGYARIFLNTGTDQMAANLMHMLEKYEVQGVVMHSNRSCKPYSLGQYDIQRILQQRLGIPTLMIEADMLDERVLAEGQIENRIDAFMEML